MLVVDGNYRFSAGETGDNAENLSWLDMAQREFEKQADAQISIVSAYDEDSKGFTVDCTVKSALSMTGQNINLFAVVTEDNVLTYQQTTTTHTRTPTSANGVKVENTGNLPYIPIMHHM